MRLIDIVRLPHTFLIENDSLRYAAYLTTEQIDDPYRRGIIAVHDAEIAAELEWLRSMLGVENESVTE